MKKINNSAARESLLNTLEDLQSTIANVIHEDNKVTVVEVLHHSNLFGYIRAVASTTRHPIDEDNRPLAVQIATARAYAKLATTLERRTLGEIKHIEDVAKMQANLKPIPKEFAKNLPLSTIARRGRKKVTSVTTKRASKV